MELEDFFKACAIIFVPRCQHCGTILDSVQVKQTTDLVSADDKFESKVHQFIHKKYEIQPDYCPNCGYSFTSIYGPGDIYDSPYNVTEMFNKE